MFAVLLSRPEQVRRQRQKERSWKFYSLHAPEVDRSGKGTAPTPRRAYFKWNIATVAIHPKGGQFLLQAKALHDNPYDRHARSSSSPS